MFANLLTNAAKYTPNHGRIRVISHKRDQQIAIEIHDSGRGISAELLPRVFTPFVQATQTIERAEGGLGLGLALANSIVESHAGKITVHSAGPDQGSTFTVVLPEAVPVNREASERIEVLQPSAAASDRQILIVDDNEDAAELLAILLRKQGHKVVVAHDPVKALEAIREKLPDVAFLDIGLPVMDGYELAARLRKELGNRCPALIAVTGYGQQKDRERSRAASFALHLVKPVQQTSVLDALKQVSTTPPRKHD